MVYLFDILDPIFGEVYHTTGVSIHQTAFQQQNLLKPNLYNNAQTTLKTGNSEKACWMCWLKQS
jgi:hypothetical protein